MQVMPFYLLLRSPHWSQPCCGDKADMILGLVIMRRMARPSGRPDFSAGCSTLPLAGQAESFDWYIPRLLSRRNFREIYKPSLRTPYAVNGAAQPDRLHFEWCSIVLSLISCSTARLIHAQKLPNSHLINALPHNSLTKKVAPFSTSPRIRLS